MNVASIIGYKQGAVVGLFKMEADIMQRDILCMADEESFGWYGSEHPWFGIGFFLFRRHL